MSGLKKLGAIILSFSIVVSPVTKIYAENVKLVNTEADSSGIENEKEMFRYTSPYGEVIDYYFGEDGKTYTIQDGEVNHI